MDTVYKFVDTNGSLSMFYEFNGAFNSETLSLDQQLSLDAQTKAVTLKTTYDDYIRVQTFVPTISTADDPANYTLSGETFTNLQGQVILHAPTPMGIDDAGTDGNDTTHGGEGDDHLFGMAGNDRLDGNGGNDRLSGGAGNDNLTGDAGDDVLFGGDGNDRLDGGAHDDIAYGGDGNDLIFGGSGNDYLVGEAGADRISGGTGNDFINAGSENDRVWGDSGNDTIRAGDGNDIVYGGSGNDTLFGDAGNDRLSGGDGNDIIFGSEGADRLDGGTGVDTTNGGLGNDVYVVDSSQDIVAEGLTDGGRDTVFASASFDLGFASSIENLILTGSSDLHATGNEQNNAITGNAGDNLILGGGGNDVIRAGAGDDTINGGSGRDILIGGAGADHFVFNSDIAGATAATADRIADFDAGAGDRIDLSALDGDLTVDGRQAFSFVGSAAFSHTAGELRFAEINGNTTVYGDQNGDGLADFAIRIDGLATLHQGDIVL